jgi:hypothetical protein
MTIIAAQQDAGSYRRAAICGTTHKTVRRVIERAGLGVRPAPKQRAHNYAVGADLVAVRVKKSPRPDHGQAVTAGRVHVGPDRNFRRLVAQVKRAGGSSTTGAAGHLVSG